VALRYVEDQRFLVFILASLLIVGIVSVIAMTRKRNKRSYTVDPQVDGCCSE
jgi:hypothetical protein